MTLRNLVARVSSSTRVLSATLLVALAGPGGAQAYRLSDPATHSAPAGDVERSWSSPDGRWLVYATARGRLYSVERAQRAPVPLTAPLFGVDTQSLLISPDGRRVVFLRPTPGQWVLYSVPVDGSAEPTRLNGPVSIDSDAIVSFSITADGRTVVFRPPTGLLSISFRFGLFSVPIDGSAAPARLDAPGQGPGVQNYLPLASSPRVLFTSDGQLFSSALSGGDLRPLAAGETFRVTPDETYAVSLSAAHGLFGVPLRSGIPVQLASNSVDWRFAVTPDGERVVFLSTFPNSELFSAPLDGSAAPLRLNTPLPGGGRVRVGFWITPTGRVIYCADQTTSHVFELFSVPADGSAPPLRLHPALSGERDVGLATEQDTRLISQLSPDGSRVAYIADQRQEGRLELFSVASDGSAAAVALHDPPVPGGNVGPGFRFSSDGARVVFGAHSTVGGHLELFSAPAKGGGPAIRLSADMDPEGDVQSFELLPDSGEVAYVADAAFDEAFELFGAPLDGSRAPVRLNVPFALVSTGDVSSFRILPDGSRALYLMDRDADGVQELFSVPADGSTSSVKLSGPLWLQLGYFQPYQITADGSRVAFLADQDGDGRFELCSAPSDGSGPTIALSAPFPPGSSASFQLAPDGARAVYLADEPGRPPEIYSVRLDGSAPPALLASGSHVFRISPDSSTVIYERIGLFAVSIVGDAPARSLTNFVPAIGIPNYALTRDGARVVFRASDPNQTPRTEQLFSVPTDGSSPPLQLTAAPGGATLLSPLGAANHVVYVADQDNAQVFELYGVPADGSLPPRKLSGPLTAGGNVHHALLSPDGSRVLYSADALVNDQDDIFSVPIDGSASALRIAVSVYSSPATWSFDPTGARFLYMGSQLNSVLADGSAAPVRIAPWGTNYTISADGRHVLYPSIEHLSPEREFPALFWIPIDASAEARRLTGPYDARGEFSNAVKAWQIDPHSERVLYLADENGQGAFELFAVPLQPTKVQRQR